LPIGQKYVTDERYGQNKLAAFVPELRRNAKSQMITGLG
jgi:hypothetical protein